MSFPLFRENGSQQRILVSLSDPFYPRMTACLFKSTYFDTLVVPPQVRRNISYFEILLFALWLCRPPSGAYAPSRSAFAN